ncbi:MAG: hypothetical protein HY908_02120 [Myxococcales bacterium]|nr:hypothetical protein [Myxococcales bacterium]
MNDLRQELGAAALREARLLRVLLEDRGAHVAAQELAAAIHAVDGPAHEAARVEVAAAGRAFVHGAPSRAVVETEARARLARARAALGAFDLAPRVERALQALEASAPAEHTTQSSGRGRGKKRA